MLKVFRIDRRRNRAAFRKLLFAFVGYLVTDRFSVYRIHDLKKRQLCWAHLLRNFLGLEERGGAARSLGVAGQRIVKDVFREWYRFREGEITRRALRRKLKPIRRWLERLLRRHMSNPVPAARKIAKDLREYGAALWTFAKVEGVEPTNNAAERAMRTRRGLRRRLAPLRLALKHLLQRHINSPVPAASKIAKDLREYGAALWTFARVEGVEPTNNAAERAVRKAVLWRKTSFGSASRWGSRFVERMLTVCESLRAQGRSILEFLEAAIRGGRSGSGYPTLLPG